MIAAEREHAPATEQVEILPVIAVVEILPLPTPVRLVETNRLEHADHLLVQIACVQGVAFRLPFGKEAFDVEAHSCLQIPLRDSGFTQR